MTPQLDAPKAVSELTPPALKILVGAARLGGDFLHTRSLCVGEQQASLRGAHRVRTGGFAHQRLIARVINCLVPIFAETR